MALQKGLAQNYIVQDDVRQHLIWMQRLADPELFKNDLIVNYFQSVAPWGYYTLYKVLISVLGIQPIILTKVIPIFLGGLTTLYCFFLSFQILPIPFGGFLSCTLLNQLLWLDDSLVSATPRAFLYPLFLALLYYITQESILLMSVALILLGLFYPQLVLVSFVLFGLKLLGLRRNGTLRFANSTLQLSQPSSIFRQQSRRLCCFGLGISVVIIFLYAVKISEFSPIISANAARQLSEFGGAGNSAFFYGDFWQFWLWGQRSGLLPQDLFKPLLIIFGLSLPVLISFPEQFPLTKRLQPSFNLILQVLVASFSLFFAAHFLLFRLHLPSRYTHHTLRICLALAASVSLCVVIDRFFQYLSQVQISRTKLAILRISSVLILALIGLINPVFWQGFPRSNYVKGHAPDLYAFFVQQPQETLIASISREADNFPIFAKRAIWFGWEYAVPYHQGYYQPIQLRATEFIQAQYSPEIRPMQDLIQAHQIDFVVIDRDAFQPEYLLKNPWLRQWYHSLGKEIQQMTQQGQTIAVERFSQKCSVQQTEKLMVLDGKCLLSAKD